MKKITAYAALVIDDEEDSPRKKVTVRFRRNEDQIEFRISPQVEFSPSRPGTGVICLFTAETGPEWILKMGTDVVVNPAETWRLP